MKQHHIHGTWIILAAIAIAAAFSSISLAIPVPHGITGTIYDLDGITQVPAGIDFNISNAANGFAVAGKTGRTTPGGYAASVAGDDGNTITITAWNIEHSSTKTIPLEGVLRNVTLLLNMTLQPYAPNITSTPVTSALEGTLYQYDADASDYNFDHITYSLFSAPAGMIIESSTGLIQWTPKNADVGEHTVTIIANDSNLTDSQTFTIAVENVNDAPEITSLPETRATVNRLYTYQINATDPDNETLIYSLLQAPDKMDISSAGLVTWTPRKPQAGNNTIIVQASDGMLAATQLFVINVADFNPPGQVASTSSSSSRAAVSSGGGGFVPSTTGASEHQLLVSKDRSTPVTELLIKFRSPVENAVVSVEELSARPEGIETIQKRVYKYIKIDGNFDNSQVEEATIQFAVGKSWLDANKIMPENIILSHYSGNKWNELPTSVESESAGEVSYTSKTSGFSVFAITVKSEKSAESVNDDINTASSNGVAEAYAIAGYILKSNGKLQAEQGTPFTLLNARTNDSVSGTTGIGQATGAFLAIIPGRIGDEIRMSAGSISRAEGKFTLKGDMENLQVISKGPDLVFLEASFSNTLDSKITGYVTAVQNAPKSALVAAAFMLVVIATTAYNIRKSRKTPEAKTKRRKKLKARRKTAKRKRRKSKK